MSAISTAKDQVLIIGGGVSGLAAAFFLGQRNIPTVLVEKSGRLGGLIQTNHIDGCDLEAGPDSYLAAKTSVAALAQELGISSRIIGSNDAERRILIGRKGRLVPLPPGMVFMVPGELGPALRSPIFSLATKVRFLTERRMPPYERAADVSVEQFVREHFGPDILSSLVEPLLSGVYGGEAGQLSATSVLPTFVEYERQFGSLMKGVAANRKPPGEGGLFRSFAGGMQTLTDALAASLVRTTEVRFGTARNLTQTSGGWQVQVGEETLAAKQVLLACPAHACAELVDPISPALATHLESIPYSSAILVTLVYERAELAHPLNGFGFLIPGSERRHIAAATWISTKFPSRTPENRAALRAFVVGKRALELANANDDELIEIVQNEFRDWMGITAQPSFSTCSRWPASMPQYLVGHADTYAGILKELNELSGLHICGNAYTGVGIPDCIRMAREVSERINLNQTGTK